MFKSNVQQMWSKTITLYNVPVNQGLTHHAQNHWNRWVIGCGAWSVGWRRRGRTSRTLGDYALSDAKAVLWTWNKVIMTCTFCTRIQFWKCSYIQARSQDFGFFFEGGGIPRGGCREPPARSTEALTFHYIIRERRRFVGPYSTLNPYLNSVSVDVSLEKGDDPLYRPRLLILVWIRDLDKSLFESSSPSSARSPEALTIH